MLNCKIPQLLVLILGHWEGDLVFGKDHKSAIGTIVESKTRFTIIVRLNSKKADEVAK